MLDARHGYVLGMAIAFATCGSFFYTGTMYGAYMAPVPCIDNLHTMSHPWFARLNQEYLEDTDLRVWFEDTADQTIMSGNLFFKSMMAGAKDPDLYEPIIIGRDGEEYHVPHGCYGVNLDGFNGPTLLRK